MNKSEAILISSVPNIIYLTGFLGFSDLEREAFVLITKNNKYLATDKRYSDSLKINGFKIIDTGAYNFIVNLNEILKKEKIKSIGIEGDNLTVNEYLILKKQFKLFFNDFKKIRTIKSPDEIKKIKKACKTGDEAFEYILKKIRLGVTENQISNYLLAFFESKNTEMSFNPIVAFGKHSSIPHHQNTNIKLNKNQIILMDFGVKFENYCSDMTRTVFFGKPDHKYLKIYQTVKDAQEQAINFVNKNANKIIKLSDVDKAARDYILQSGFESIPHSLGHGIGLEVHESPNLSPKSDDLLSNNMVFSIEPGIYINNYGGVRIEDLVVVRNNKLELISHANREIITIND